MEIKELKKRLDRICVEFMLFQKNNIEAIQELVPQIEEFIMWFLGGNQFGVEDELYKSMSRNLLDILIDMAEGIKYGDRVLLHDAVAYGLSEYLDLFLPEEEGERCENCI